MPDIKRNCRTKSGRNGRPAGTSEESGLFGELALFDLQRSLAGTLAEVEKLRATGLAVLEDGHAFNIGRVDRDDPLDTDAMRNLADGDGLGRTGTPVADDNAFERLKTLFFAFDDAQLDPYGITGVGGGAFDAGLGCLD